MKKQILSIIFFIFSFQFILSQSDSLNYAVADSLVSEGFKNIGKNDIALGIKQLGIALTFGKKIKHDSLVTRAYNNLAVAYIGLEMYDEAKLYIDSSRTSAKRSSFNKVLFLSHNNYGTIFLLKQDTINAIEAYKKARDFCLKTKDTFSLVWPSHNIGSLKLDLKKYNEAKPYLIEVEQYYVKNSMHQPVMLIANYWNKAKVEINENNFDIALDNLKKADSLSLELNNYDYLHKTEVIRNTIYDIKKEDKKIINSLSLQNKYLIESKKQQKEEIDKANSLKKQILEQNQKLKFKDQLNQTQKAQLKTTTIITTICLILLVIAIISLYYLKKINKANKKLNTDLTKTNKYLTDSKEETEYASKLKESFFSTISHELRTPLYAVTGITNILIEDNPKLEQKDNLKALKSSGDHLLSLINNILQIKKIDADKIQINSFDFNIKKITNKLKSTLSYLQKENNNTIEVIIDKNVPEALKGDSLKLTQILINLINNALKFTQNGNIILVITLVSKIEDLINLKFSVKDNGIGISKEAQKKIFEDFYQESMLLERNYEGTGLGLAIVKRLLSTMNSTIKVDSKLGEGSNFYFELSFKEIKSNAKNEKLDTKIQYDLTNHDILVVDDNPINQMITKRLLENKNASVTLVNNGFDAIKIAEKTEFDIILMDIHMPKINGYETTKEIRTFDKKTPIIALTAIKIDDNKDQIYDAGMNGIILKPFLLETFFHELFLHINKKVLYTR